MDLPPGYNRTSINLEKIGIIGIGKLGLCLALQLENAGYEVIGVDISESYIDELNSKRFKSSEPMVDAFLERSKHFKAAGELEELIRDDIGVIFIHVATASNGAGVYDHSQLDQVAEDLIQIGKRASTVELVIGCTTMPGYCDILADKLSGLSYNVSYNPEFIAQGTVMHDIANPDMVLIGEASNLSGKKIEEIYRSFCEKELTVHKMDRLSAEICKLGLNCFLTLKISFANAIGDLAVISGLDPHRLLSAIGSDSRVGGRFLNYGFGFGGPCLPQDNRSLNHFANQQGYELLLSKITDEVNKRHLEFQFQQWLQNHTENQIIEFELVTYKPTAISIAESQKLQLALKLAEAGRAVCIKERAEVIEEIKSRYGDIFTYKTHHVS